jgi:predicted GNAT family acetyltransferase
VERTIDYRLHSDVSGLYVWDDNRIVSYAGFGGPTPHGIRIGPVYTPPEYRQHGYASACVAGMSQLILKAGRQFCFLFTDLRNPTSNHIYQVIGYQPVCDFTEYVFASE